uniref:AEC family transporter n=1 Tax=Pararhizobium sp. IMCC3301 TaxID=3067904 RepID=UPI002740E0AD|nr:AEC family transporter [Pararhizobium sp. IMCC3301]
MLESFETLLPVFIVIVLGVIMRRKMVTDPAFWLGAERLTYWILLPSLLAKTLIDANLKGGQASTLALALFVAVFIYGFVILALKPLLVRGLGMSIPAYSTIYQVSTRWSGFIALAIVEKLYDESGVSLVAVALAAMVPIVNLQNVTILTLLLSDKRPSILRLSQSVFSNPLILGCMIGLVINLLSIPIYQPVLTTLDILGSAALGVALILVGTGLKLRAALKPSRDVWIGVFLKLILFPALVAVLAFIFGLTGEALAIAIICASVPTAMNGYLLAKELGGDAPLYAAVTTIQTAVSFVTIPLFLSMVS